MIFEFVLYTATVLAVLAFYGSRKSVQAPIVTEDPDLDLDQQLTELDWKDGSAPDLETDHAWIASVEIQAGITSDPIEPNLADGSYVELATAANAEFWQSVATDNVVSFKRQHRNDAETLAKLTIRQLKKLASDRRIKGYCNLRKAELVAALAG